MQKQGSSSLIHRNDLASQNGVASSVWLARGMMAGSLLALVECGFAVLTGYDLSLGYLALVLFIDLITGAFVGLASAVGIRLLALTWGGSFSTAFAPIATGILFVFLLDKAVWAAKLRDWSGFVGVGVLVLASCVALPAIVWSLRRLCRTVHRELSLAVSFLLLGVFLVSVEYYVRSAFISYLSVEGILVNAVMALLLIGGILGQDRLLRIISRRRRRSALQLVPVVLSATCLVTFLLWTISLPAEIVIPEPEPSGRGGGRPPILLISIDTLRADHLSCYGYEVQTTPSIDRLASDGILYENAISPSSWTLPGHASILTGTFPRQHSAHFVEPGGANAEESLMLPAVEMRAFPLHPDNVTLAEILSAAGYRTAGIVANAAFLHRTFGLDQGFQFYDDRERRRFGYEPLISKLIKFTPYFHDAITKPYRLASDINRVAFDWLSINHEEPFFLFLNYMDPHRPYRPPAGYSYGLYNGRFFMNPSDIPGGEMRLSDEERDFYLSLYDGEIAYVDHHVGLLIEKLKELGVYDETLIIVTSDHGEFFGEHGVWEHTVGPYEEVYKVPLIVKYPGSGKRGRDSRWVQTVDILPEVLETVGLPIPADVEGSPLSLVDHPILTEQYPNTYWAKNYGSRYGRSYRSVYERPWKLIVYIDDTMELYNLAEDPFEQNNLFQQEQRRAIAMRRRLRKYIASLSPTRPADEAVESLDDSTVKRLKALGYVQ